MPNIKYASGGCQTHIPRSSGSCSKVRLTRARKRLRKPKLRAQSRDDGYKTFDKLLGISPQNSPSRGPPSERASKPQPQQTAVVDDEEYRKLEAELAKRTGGLFTETDEQLPQSLRRAKEKFTTPEMKAKRREALKGVLEDYAKPKPRPVTDQLPIIQKPTRPGFAPQPPPQARPAQPTVPQTEPVLSHRPQRGFQHFKEQFRTDNTGETGAETMSERRARLARNQLSELDLSKKGLTAKEIQDLLEARPKAAEPAKAATESTALLSRPQLQRNVQAEEPAKVESTPEPAAELLLPKLQSPRSRPSPPAISEQPQAQQPLPELKAPASRPSIPKPPSPAGESRDDAKQASSASQLSELTGKANNFNAPASEPSAVLDREGGKAQPTVSEAVKQTDSPSQQSAPDSSNLLGQAATIASSVQQLERPQWQSTQASNTVQASDASLEPVSDAPQPAESNAGAGAEESEAPPSTSVASLPTEAAEQSGQLADALTMESAQNGGMELPRVAEPEIELKRPVRAVSKPVEPPTPASPRTPVAAAPAPKRVRKNSISTSDRLAEIAGESPVSALKADSANTTQPSEAGSPDLQPAQPSLSKPEDTGAADDQPVLVSKPPRSVTAPSGGGTPPQGADSKTPSLLISSIKEKYALMREYLHSQEKLDMVVHSCGTLGYSLRHTMSGTNSQVGAYMPYSTLHKKWTPGKQGKQGSSKVRPSGDNAEERTEGPVYKPGDVVPVYVRVLSARAARTGTTASREKDTTPHSNILGKTNETWSFLSVLVTTESHHPVGLWNICARQRASAEAVAAARQLLGQQVQAICLLNSFRGSILELKVKGSLGVEEKIRVMMPSRAYAPDVSAPEIGQEIKVWVCRTSDDHQVVTVSMLKPLQSSLSDQETVNTLVGEIEEANFLRSELQMRGIECRMGPIRRCKGFQPNLAVSISVERPYGEPANKDPQSDDAGSRYELFLRKGFASQMLHILDTEISQADLKRIAREITENIETGMASTDSMDMSLSSRDSLDLDE